MNLLLSISITLFSGNIGFYIAKKMKHNDFYFKEMRAFIITKKIKIYHFIGIKQFAWIVKNTFFSGLNKKIKVTNRLSISESNYLLDEITISEICHLFGFLIVLFVQVYSFISYGFNNFIIYTLILNTALNFYPFLLQQRNKIRIYKFISNLEQ